MLDHVFITVKDLERSIAFYEAALKPLGITHVADYDGKDGPEGHPISKALGGAAGSSSGYDRALQMRRPRMSASLPRARPR